MKPQNLVRTPWRTIYGNYPKVVGRESGEEGGPEWEVWERVVDDDSDPYLSTPHLTRAGYRRVSLRTVTGGREGSRSS